MANRIIECVCRECKRTTNHEILFSHSTHSDDPDYWWTQDYMIVKCCGCDTVAHCDGITEEGNTQYDEEGNEYMETEYMVRPNPINLIDSINIYDLPLEIRKIYTETIDCINRRNVILAAAGCRATIEAVCHHQSIKGQQLETMINNLSQQKIITKKDRDHLHAIRFMGNNSIHEAKEYDIKELIIVAKILNIILTSLYIIHEEFLKLKEKPVTSYDEFLKVLDDKLDGFKTGEIGNLDHFLKGIRRIIKEDRKEFESNLINEISIGKYTRLSLAPPINPKASQRYKLN